MTRRKRPANIPYFGRVITEWRDADVGRGRGRSTHTLSARNERAASR